MHILPALRRVQIEDDVEAMLFAMAQHLVETLETGLLVFEWRAVVFKVPVIQWKSDNRSAAFSQEDHIVFVEEVVKHALEEKLSPHRTKHLRHLRAKRVLCARMAVDEVFHVHPAAGARAPETNLVALGVHNVPAADSKELHAAFAARVVHSHWTRRLFRACPGRLADQRCSTGQRRQLEKLAPRPQFNRLLRHNTSSQNSDLTIIEFDDH